MPVDLVTIEKNGKLANIEKSALSKGDIVVLQAGDLVPADLNLREARSLEVDEFDLTGEILPVKKEMGEREVHLYEGSRVLKGTGKGVAIAIGDQTEYGRVLRQQWKTDVKPHLSFFKPKYLLLVLLIFLPALKSLLSNHQSVIPIEVLGLLAVLLILLQNDELFRSLLLLRWRKYLAKHNVEVLDTSALEKMSQIDIVCFDKTGVLTSRNIEVTGIVPASGETSEVVNRDQAFFNLVIQACTLCHDLGFYEKRALANPVDEAMISFAVKNKVDVQEVMGQVRRVYDSPFDSERRSMECGYVIEGGIRFFTKGDPAVILNRCDHYLTGTGLRKKVDHTYWRNTNEAIRRSAKYGNSVIALAYSDAVNQEVPQRYTFICLLALESRLLPGVEKTIRWMSLQGIRSIMLTGDREETAVRIGKESAISDNSSLCLTGNVLNNLAGDEIIRQIEFCPVYAQLIPSQKGVLIRMMQRNGHAVAMVGDNINDVLALKAADVGILVRENTIDFVKRFSKILIKDANDLVLILESTAKIKNHLRIVRILRFLAIFTIMIYAVLRFFRLL